MNDDEFIKELHARVHRHGNAISKIEGQALADRMVNEERYRQVEANTAGIRGDLTALTAMVAQQSAAMSEVVQGQKSILQTMGSDRQTVVATATALADAERARRDRSDEPWVTPNRIIGLTLGVLALAAYASRSFS